MRCRVYLVAVCCAVVGIFAPGMTARGAGEVGDAKIVASMKRGVDYLLRMKKGDNWEGFYSQDRRNAGGETALVLAALLEAGQSLREEGDMRLKLDPHGAELEPALRWLAAKEPGGTYAAGLTARAMALAMSPKPGESEDWSKASAETCKWYLLAAMGVDGGYSYEIDRARFETAYQAYVQDALAGKRGRAKLELDNVMVDFARYFGGPEALLRWKAFSLQEKAKQTKDAREIAQIKAELKELDGYARQMSVPSWKTIQDQRIASYRRSYESLLKQQQSGINMGTSREDLARHMTSIKESLARMEKRFEPMGDTSNAYTGLVGAASLAGASSVPAKYWETSERFWRTTQRPDGSWPYYVLDGAKSQATKTVGVEGLASLLVSRSYTDTEIALKPKPDKNVEAALAWLVKEYPAGEDLRDPYFLCAVQRVGEMLGLKRLGLKKWYAEAAADLVSRQHGDGSWGGRHETRVNTACALTFLARVRNPVLFNKLQYNGPWNARPWDAMFATRWLEERSGQRMNWQVVSLNTPVEDWQDAPVLLITGSQDPKFSKEDVEKFAAFIAGGGMIFSSADGANAGFTAAMKRYASQAMAGKFEMRPLQKNHELFSKEAGTEVANPAIFLGLSDGAREVWIHSSGDAGADWQLRRTTNRNSFEMALAVYNHVSKAGKLKPRL